MMSETLEPVATEVDQRRLAEQLLAQAKELGVELVGPNGLLNQLTKNELETALDAEMTEHLGYDKHDPVGRGSGNSRNGTRAKTVLTEIGPVDIEVPRDTNSSFDPQIVKKRQRRLTGIDEIVLSLTAKGLTTGEVAAHFADVYGATVSKDTISRITDKVIAEMTEWCNRPLEVMYPVVFIDAIHVKIRDGQVANRPIYVAIGVTCAGERDILGLWAGEGGEGAKFWLAVLTEIKNRGTTDVCIVVCDGLKGLSDAVTTVWDRAVVQTCVLHLLRNPQVLGQDGQRHPSGLHRADRIRSQGTLRRVHRELGSPVPGDHPTLGERLERIRAVLGLRRGNPTRHLQHECHRITQRPLPARDPRPRALPNRTGRDEMPLPRDPFPRPHRPRQGTMGNEVEASAQCVRDHLQRPDHPDRQLTMPRSDPPLIRQPRSTFNRRKGVKVQPSLTVAGG
jgi:hypothetical protein